MEKLWTKTFILAIIGTFLLFVAFYMLYPTLPLFIKLIGGNETHVGFSMGVFMFSAVFFRPFVGSLLDQFGRKPFVIFGLLLFAFSMFIYSLIDKISNLMFLRIIHGISWAFTTTSIATVVADVIPPTRYGEGMGWYGTSMTLAMAFSPAFGVWTIQNLSYKSFFLIATIISLLAFALYIFIKAPVHLKPSSRKLTLFENSVLLPSLSVFFLFVSYASITTFVPLFANNLKVNSGLFFLFYSLTLLLSRPLGGRLSDKRGERFVLIPGLLITTLGLIVLSLSRGLFGVLAAAILYGFGFGATSPVLQAVILKLVSSERRGVANASFSTATDLGIGLGAILFGWIAEYMGYRLLFFIGAVMVLLSLITIFSLKRKVETLKK
jgi:MFS family permease